MFIAGKYEATETARPEGDVQVAVDAYGRVKLSSTAPLGGGITWGAPAAVAVTAGPASTTLVAANASRRALIIFNPIGNNQMGVRINGGTAVLATSIPLLAGGVMSFEGSDCPVGAITFIGTAGESLCYQEGT